MRSLSPVKMPVMRETCVMACETNLTVEGNDDALGMLVYGNGWRPAGRLFAQCMPHDHGGASMKRHSGRSRQQYMAADMSQHNLASCQCQQCIHLLVCDYCVVHLHIHTSVTFAIPRHASLNHVWVLPLLSLLAKRAMYTSFTSVNFAHLACLRKWLAYMFFLR